jgi:hypothetical protein
MTRAKSILICSLLGFPLLLLLTGGVRYPLRDWLAAYRYGRLSNLGGDSARQGQGVPRRR